MEAGCLGYAWVQEHCVITLAKGLQKDCLYSLASNVVLFWVSVSVQGISCSWIRRNWGKQYSSTCIDKYTPWYICTDIWQHLCVHTTWSKAAHREKAMATSANVLLWCAWTPPLPGLCDQPPQAFSIPTYKDCFGFAQKNSTLCTLAHPTHHWCF